MKKLKKLAAAFVLSTLILFGTTAVFAETDNKVREMANETYMETDNKVREMANETRQETDNKVREMSLTEITSEALDDLLALLGI
jgi:hypothetical protein